jgi:hypothetical protein
MGAEADHSGGPQAKEQIVKKVLLMALPVLAAAALVIPTAFAGNGPANKATGDISYANPWTGVPTHITFVAQDLGGGSAKGSMSYEDSTGSYQARVIEAHVADNQHASFTALVTSSAGAYAGMPVGTRVPMVVEDNGEPGVHDNATWLDPTDNNHPYTLGPLTAGNIQVHYNS